MNSGSRIASGPGVCTAEVASGMPNSSSTGSTWPFCSASSRWFQPWTSRGKQPPRCSGRQVRGRCCRRSVIFTIWTCNWITNAIKQLLTVVSSRKLNRFFFLNIHSYSNLRKKKKKLLLPIDLCKKKKTQPNKSVHFDQ